MRVTLLGCGTSSGVPRIGPDWGQCDPNEPRNRRRRVSVMVEAGGARVVVDTSPDFREQMLSAGVATLDAVFFTHDHADHTHGIDDLRGIMHNIGGRVPCYASADTWAVLKPRFGYMVEGSNGYPAIIEAHAISAPVRIANLTVTPFRQLHGTIDSTGYRFDADGASFAYSTDLNAIPRDSEPALHGLDLWIVDALRRKPHPTHPHLALTLDWIARFSPRRAVITHMDTSMDYQTLLAELPAPVEPGYDGLVIDLP